MGIEENKRTVLAFLKSFETETDYSLLCEDVHWWIPGRGKIDLEQFKALQGKVGDILKTPVYLTIDHVTAEGDRVAVEFRGRAETRAGGLYENTYHFLFRLRDGLICESREHNNTAIPAALFSAASERRADK